jgi:hypothetical protein
MVNASAASRLRPTPPVAGKPTPGSPWPLSPEAAHRVSGDVFEGRVEGQGHRPKVADSARILAAAATRQRPDRGEELIGADRQAWAELRAELAERRERRSERRRFRRDPERYLRQLEAKLLQPSLPT